MSWFEISCDINMYTDMSNTIKKKQSIIAVFNTKRPMTDIDTQF